MGWQDLAVLIVVGCAAVFLWRRFVMPARRRVRPAQTFIPLSEVKRRHEALAPPRTGRQQPGRARHSTEPPRNDPD